MQALGVQYIERFPAQTSIFPSSHPLTFATNIPNASTLQLGANLLGPHLGAEGLGALDGRADGTVDDELREDTDGAGNTEEDGVVVLLGEAVVLEKDTGVGIDVGVGVLGLAVLCKNAGGDVVDLGDELEHRVIREMLESELALRGVARVSLAKHSMTVAGNDLAALEGGPKVVLDGLVREIAANRLLHLGQPAEHFLVGKTVERTSKTVKASSDGEEGRAERRADKVGGVGGDVATLVIGVDGEVKTHQLDEVLVLREAELVGQVVSVVLVLLHGRDLAVLVDVAVDLRRNGWELGNKVHRVLEGILPVLGLGHALLVGFGEGRLTLKSGHSEGELGHGVEVGGAAVEELGNVGGKIAAGSPLSRQLAHLLFAGDLAGKKEPEETCGG